MTRCIVSVDLGQAMDPTAISVLEIATRRDAVDDSWRTPPGELAGLVDLSWFPPTRQSRSSPNQELYWPDRALRVDVRYLERLPLRMSYPDQCAHIAALLRRAPVNTWPRLVVDQTGVGRPVVEILRRGGLHPIGVTITGGDKETRDYASGYEEWKVPKLALVSNLQALLNLGTLRIDEGLPNARALTEEMQDFRANISESGYTRFGAREGAHDDLVLSVAIGCWYAIRPQHQAVTQVVHV